jgi:hypothetical protein
MQLTIPGRLPARPQPAAKAENVPNRNPALPHRLRCALHQQPGRTGPQDDEGQDEDLRFVPNPGRRSNLRTPQIRRVHRQKTRPQHPPNPHRNPRSHHRRPRWASERSRAPRMYSSLRSSGPAMVAAEIMPRVASVSQNEGVSVRHTTGQYPVRFGLVVPTSGSGPQRCEWRRNSPHL